MNEKKPTYEELKARLTKAENVIKTLKKGETFLTEIPIALPRQVEVEEAINKSERRFLENLLPVGIVQADLNGNVIYVNKRICIFTGLPLEDHYGDGWSKAIHPEDREVAISNWQQTIEGKGDFTKEFRFLATDGNVTYVSSQLITITDDSNKPIGFAGTLVDITEHKWSEEALHKTEQRWRSLVSNIPDIIVNLDRNGTILFINNTIPGYTVEGTIGKTVYDFIPPEYHEITIKAIETVFKTGESVNFETKVIGSDGCHIWYSTSLGAIKEGEKIISVAQVSTNISERKRSEEVIRRFRSISDKAVHGNAIADLQGNITYINDYFAQVHGYTSDELIGQNLSIFHNEKQLETVRQINESLMKEGSYNSTEVWHTHKDGTEFLMLMSGIVITDKNGRPQYIAATAIDITKRKQAEDAVRKNEENQRVLLDNIQTQVWYLMNDHTYGAVNKARAEFNGLKIEDMTNRNMYEILPKDVVEICRKGNVEVFETGRMINTEEWVPHVSGEQRLLSIVKSPKLDSKGNVEYVVCSAEDVTERRKMENALRKSEEKFRLLYNNSPDMNVSISSDDSFIHLCNETLLENTGYAREEILGASVFKLYHEDCLDDAKNTFQQFVETGIIRDKALIIKRKDGSKIDVSLNVNSIKDETGKILFSISSWRDISDRKLVERTLRDNEERYRTLFETVSDSIMLFDTNMNQFIDVNAATFQLYGYNRNEFLKLKYTDITEEPKKNSKIIKQILLEKLTIIPISYHKKKNGVVFPVEITSTFFSLQGRNIICSVVRDITERKLSEEKIENHGQELVNLSLQLIESQESERKRISRELHDEFGQSLTAIRYNLGVLKNQRSFEDKNIVKNRIEDSITILDKLLNQVHNLALELRPTMLDDLGLEATLQWYCKQFADRFNVKVQLDSGILSKRYSSLIETNLFRIIQEAMTNIAKHSRACNAIIKVLERDSDIEAIIKDDGIGFDSLNYFKFDNKHSTMGLLGIRERVNATNGNFEISSNPGEGTKLSIKISLGEGS